MYAKLLAVSLALVVIMLIASPAHAAGVVNVCDEPHLLAALAGGGVVTFSCSGTILLTNTITVVIDTALDGNGQKVTISGNHMMRVFQLNPNATLEINQLTIANGKPVFGNGGGIDNDSGTVVVRNSTFSGNVGDFGGAIDNRSGVLTIHNSTFSGNGDPYGTTTTGGAIRNIRGSVTISNSTFSSNRATAAAGAIENHTGAMTVSNSTFTGNGAGSGGAISNGGTLTITNSTLAGSHSDWISGAGGIYNWGTVLLRNTIVAGNVGQANCFVYRGEIIDGGGNLSFPDTTCPGINGDPKLGTLQNNGGLTDTMALGAGSAAIDAAVDGICEAAPVNGLDQRGVTRPQGAHCDIGAYEAALQSQLVRAFLPIIKVTALATATPPRGTPQ
jgi:hypothetical protein